MTQSDNEPALTDAQKEAKVAEWSQKEFLKVQKYSVAQGIQPKGVKKAKCQVLPPIFGIWYLESTTKGEDYWVLSGDLPTDIAPAKVATDARQALRHFSMSWQLKSANLDAQTEAGEIHMGDRETQQKYSQELAMKAEAMYQLFQDERLWKESGLTID